MSSRCNKHACAPVDDPGAAVRCRGGDLVDGHPPRLRPVPAAADDGPRLVARDLRVCNRHPEPGLGPLRAAGRHGGRPLRRLPRADRRRPVLCRRPGADGAVHLGPGLHRQRRADAGHGAGRHHLRHHLRRDRAQRRAREALVGHGRGRGGRLLRPVPDGAGGKLADRRLGLAERAVRAGADGAADPAAGLRPARTAACGRRQPGRSRACAPRCARPSATRASGC